MSGIARKPREASAEEGAGTVYEDYRIPGHFSDISRKVGMGTHPPRQVCAEGSLAVMTGSNSVQYMPSAFCKHLVTCSGQIDAAGPAQRVPVKTKAPSAKKETNHISFFMGKFLQKQHRPKSVETPGRIACRGLYPAAQPGSVAICTRLFVHPRLMGRCAGVCRRHVTCEIAREGAGKSAGDQGHCQSQSYKHSLFHHILLFNLRFHSFAIDSLKTISCFAGIGPTRCETVL